MKNMRSIKVDRFNLKSTKQMGSTTRAKITGP